MAIAGPIGRIFRPRGCHDSLWADFSLELPFLQVILFLHGCKIKFPISSRAKAQRSQSSSSIGYFYLGALASLESNPSSAVALLRMAEANGRAVLLMCPGITAKPTDRHMYSFSLNLCGPLCLHSFLTRNREPSHVLGLTCLMR